MATFHDDNYLQWYELALNEKLGIGNFLESIIELIYSSILLPGDVAIDGGANRGLHTIPMAHLVGESGKVVGFEAIPALAKELSSKSHELGLNNILIKSLAIGDRKGSVDFHHVLKDDYYSGIKEQSGLPETAKESMVKIQVELSTLDLELESEKNIRLIKLDLEGGEYHALMGASRIMAENKPLVIFENGREKSLAVYGYQRSDWFSLFKSRQYEIFDIFGREFNEDDWGSLSMPWYFIAASRESDKEFISKKLPHLIHLIFKILTRHCLSNS
jgi:FkbM family methyltransferase